MDNLYERLLAFTHDAVYRYRFRDGVVLMANEGFVRILDLDCGPADVVGRPLRDLLRYLQPEGVLRQTIAKTGEVRGLEYRFRTLKGDDRWVLHDSFISEDAATGEREVTAIARDITEQKKVEVALMESERRYRRFFEESPVSLWIEDFSAVKAYLDEVRAAGVADVRTYLRSHRNAVARCASLVRIVAVNNATLSLFRAQDREELLGNLQNVFTEESYPVFCEEIAALCEGKTVFGGEAVTRSLTGERRVVSLKWLVVPGHEATADQVLVAIVDITELKDAQTSIVRMNAELEQRVEERTQLLEATNRELEAFAYSVSHDLRAPLRSIDGFSMALLEDCGDMLSEAGKDHLRRVRAATERMGEFIDSMLQLSRANRTPIGAIPVDLATVARAVVDELTRTAPGRTVEWRLPDRLAVFGDPRLMETVVRNLLDNAWKFTSGRSHGLIELGAGGTPPPLPPTCDGLTFYVRDNGIGFDMAYADKLFNAFQRLHSDSAFPGAGIGLATVRRIVNRHGGQTWAEGKPDGGATFHVWLPNRREDAPPATASRNGPPPAPQS